MRNKRCPRCNYNKYWVIRRGKYKCTKCKHEWTPYRLPLRLTKTQWQKILRYFILGLNGRIKGKQRRLKRQKEVVERGSNPYSVYFVVMDMYGLNLFPMWKPILFCL